MNDQQETTQKCNESKSPNRKSLLVGLFLGAVAGAVLCGAAVVTAMPRMMIVTQESRLGFDETVEALEKAIPEKGWVVSTVSDMNKSMAKHGVEFAPSVKIVELCKADYARDVLSTNPEVSTLMPCAWGVYQASDGKVYITGMNMGLMGKMFGGTIAEVMGTKVAADEARILRAVIRG